MPRKATNARNTPQIKRPAAGKNLGLDITSDSIAADLAAFRKRGGRIEVLGNTPMRVNVTEFRSKGNTKRKQTAAATKTAAKA